MPCSTVPQLVPLLVNTTAGSGCGPSRDKAVNKNTTNTQRPQPRAPPLWPPSNRSKSLVHSSRQGRVKGACVAQGEKGQVQLSPEKRTDAVAPCSRSINQSFNQLTTMASRNMNMGGSGATRMSMAPQGSGGVIKARQLVSSWPSSCLRPARLISQSVP
jgi:hypothetical protein